MEEGGDTRSQDWMRHPDYGTPVRHYPEDEISLFDLCNILIRRWRWVVGVGLVVVLLGIGHVLTRVEQYAYTHAIEIGQWPVIDPARSAVENIFEDGSRFLEPPKAVAAKLREKNLPAAIGAWQESHSEADWRPGADEVSADDSGVVTMRAEDVAERESAYREIFQQAARRLSEDHERIMASTRKALEVELSRARNELESLEQDLAHRTRELQRIERHLGMVDEEIEALEALLKEAEQRLAVAQRNPSDPSQAIMAMMLTNDLFAAHERLDKYQLQRAVELPRQRDQVETEIAELERKMEVQKQVIVLHESRIETVTPTRALSEPQRSVAPVGTNGRVIVALSVVLGGMLGVFVAFFVEFVHAASRRWRERDEAVSTSAP